MRSRKATREFSVAKYCGEEPGIQVQNNDLCRLCSSARVSVVNWSWNGEILGMYLQLGVNAQRRGGELASTYPHTHM